MKKFTITLLIFLFMASSVFGATRDLTLQWKANTESDLATGTKARYKVYIRNGSSLAGVKANATQVFEVQVTKDEDPSPTLVQFTIKGLNDQIKYYCAVDAWDETGNASGLSNEVSTIVPDITPPEIPVGLKILQWLQTILSKYFGGLRIS